MADLKALMMSVIGIIIVIVVIYTFVGTAAPDLSDAAIAIGDSNNCSLYTECITPATGVYHLETIGDVNCSNSSNEDAGCPVGRFNLPLESLFRPNGVVVLVLMAAVLIFIVAVSFSIYKKRQ